MMMDDLFFTDPVRCPECNKVFEAGEMVWVNGSRICPECWEKSKKAELLEIKKEIDND